MLRVHVLGELEVECDGRRIAPPESRRAWALLGWLALHPGRHQRGVIASALWPDVLDSSALQSLRSALFPTHYGSADLTETSVDYFVGHTLDGTLRALHQQTQRTLSYEAGAVEADRDVLARRAATLVGAFAARLPHVRRRTSCPYRRRC